MCPSIDKEAFVKEINLAKKKNINIKYNITLLKIIEDFFKSETRIKIPHILKPTGIIEIKNIAILFFTGNLARQQINRTKKD